MLKFTNIYFIHENLVYLYIRKYFINNFLGKLLQRKGRVDDHIYIELVYCIGFLELHL